MRIIDAVWRSAINWLIIECRCGEKFEHRANKWLITCPRCGNKENLHSVRMKFVKKK